MYAVPAGNAITGGALSQPAQLPIPPQPGGMPQGPPPRVCALQTCVHPPNEILRHWCCIDHQEEYQAQHVVQNPDPAYREVMAFETHNEATREHSRIFIAKLGNGQEVSMAKQHEAAGLDDYVSIRINNLANSPLVQFPENPEESKRKINLTGGCVWVKKKNIVRQEWRTIARTPVGSPMAAQAAGPLCFPAQPQQVARMPEVPPGAAPAAGGATPKAQQGASGNFGLPRAAPHGRTGNPQKNWQRPDIKVFVCCQLTPSLLGEVQKFLGFHPEHCPVYAAMPNFNIKAGMGAAESASWMDLMYDLPSFGPDLTDAVMGIMNEASVQTTMAAMQVPPIQYAVNNMVIDRMARVDAMIATMQASLCPRPEPIRKLTEFTNMVRSLSKYAPSSVQQWHQQITNLLGGDPAWKTRLHFDVLLQNFGVTDQEAMQIRAATLSPGGQNFERYSLRWLAKGFEAYGIDGSKSDIVTLVCAMMQHPPEQGKMREVIPKLNEFRDLLADPRASLAHLWIPTHMLMDLEVDDTMAWVVLTTVHDRLGTNLRVLFQIPPTGMVQPPGAAGQPAVSRDFQTLRRHVKQVSGRVNRDRNVWSYTDPHSENGEAVAQFWWRYMGPLA